MLALLPTWDEKQLVSRPVPFFCCSGPCACSDLHWHNPILDASFLFYENKSQTCWDPKDLSLDFPDLPEIVEICHRCSTLIIGGGLLEIVLI
jgi:hypothetical protein